MWYVYILKCKDGKYYTGYSSNLKNRIKQHNEGRVKFTSKRLPVEIVCYHAFNDKYRAVFYEKYLKSGSGRAFMKRHLI